MAEKELVLSVSHKIVTKVKYLGINLTKDVEDLYYKNHRALKETEDTKK